MNTYEISFVVDEYASGDWHDSVLELKAKTEYQALKAAPGKIREKHPYCNGKYRIRSITRYL